MTCVYTHPLVSIRLSLVRRSSPFTDSDGVVDDCCIPVLHAECWLRLHILWLADAQPDGCAEALPRIAAAPAAVYGRHGAAPHPSGQAGSQLAADSAQAGRPAASCHGGRGTSRGWCQQGSNAGGHFCGSLPIPSCPAAATMPLQGGMRRGA